MIKLPVMLAGETAQFLPVRRQQSGSFKVCRCWDLQATACHIASLHRCDFLRLCACFVQGNLQGGTDGAEPSSSEQ